MKEWTIMVYMAADNSLSVEMAYALEQIKKVTAQNDDVNLYCYYDALSSDVPTLYCDFSDQHNPKHFYQSSREKKLFNVNLHNVFNENSAAVSNVINFVDWCVKKDSAEERAKKKYAFIFSGHSFGFINWGLFKDTNADYHMTHGKLRWMLEHITSDQDELNKKYREEENKYFENHKKRWNDQYRQEHTTVILGKPLDLLGFDSCVMSTLEIGSQFKKFAKTMVASEGSIPTAGWNYAQLLGKISSDQTFSQNIAVKFVNDFILQQNKFALADLSVDMSAWRLENLDGLENSLGNLADCLQQCFRDQTSVAYHQTRRLLVQVHWACQTYMFEQHIDLGDFCRLAIKEIDLLETEFGEITENKLDADSVAGSNLNLILSLRKCCGELLEKLGECILLTGFSGGDFQFSNGISLFFPWSLASYKSASDDYNDLFFIKNNKNGQKWNKFLIKYLSEVTLRKAEPLTLADQTGNISGSQVIYESYSGMENPNAVTDNFFTPLSGGKQLPNSGKQPPNSGRQPPNSGRTIDEVSLYLAKFMKLKNFQTNWNRAGFRSQNVKFQSDSLGGIQSSAATSKPKQPIQNIKAPEKPVVMIPPPITIEAKKAEIIEAIKNKITGNSDRYISAVNTLVQNSDVAASSRFLEDLGQSNFFYSAEPREKDLQNALQKSFASSVSNINNLDLRKLKIREFDELLPNQ